MVIGVVMVVVAVCNLAVIIGHYLRAVTLVRSSRKIPPGTVVSAGLITEIKAFPVCDGPLTTISGTIKTASN